MLRGTERCSEDRCTGSSDALLRYPYEMQSYAQAAERKAITMSMLLNEETDNAEGEHRPVSCRFVVDEVSILSHSNHLKPPNMPPPQNRRRHLSWPVRLCSLGLNLTGACVFVLTGFGSMHVAIRDLRLQLGILTGWMPFAGCPAKAGQHS